MCYNGFTIKNDLFKYKRFKGHSLHVKWVKCTKDFRKIEGQQIRQVVSLTERCIIEGWETKIWSTYLLSIKSYSLLFNSM